MQQPKLTYTPFEVKKSWDFSVLLDPIEKIERNCQYIYSPHINGLTFDFLYEIAKVLQEKESIMMLAGGAKDNEPLVFQDGGKMYRAFLEGRVKDKSYILLIHLSNLELKGISK